MCGIAGLFNIRAQFPDLSSRSNLLQNMMDSMRHRGPDAEGKWHDPEGRCDLGHRRLSIIDTSDAGLQPMTGIDSPWVVTFNGEIYNFQEMRPILEAAGRSFQGRTDTEVLLQGITEWGIDVLQRLDGMFALAAFNRESGELLLTRDPFGEKPLYYMELPGGGIAFASELQALEHAPGFDAEVSLDAMAEVLMFQYIGAPRTIYRNVKKLRPGHWLLARPGDSIQIFRYFEFSPGSRDFFTRPINDLADELEDILTRSLRRRMISDVPLGAFLSGGVDSSTVCALIRRKLDMPLKTFSIGFEGARESEHVTAEMFARDLQTDHHCKVMKPHIGEFLLGIGRLLDEPNADSSCLPTYLLSEFSRKQVTVAISGDGGDEMFCGYDRYFITLDEECSHNDAMRPGWNAGQAYYSGRILVSVETNIEELFGAVPHGLNQRLTKLRGEVVSGPSPLFCRLRKTDVNNYLPGAVLPKVDRMSMQHSLEVRTPFLNVELARFSEKLPRDVLYRAGKGKLILREIAYRYLPRTLIDAPKQGFGLPMSRWAHRGLLRVAEGTLKAEDSKLLHVLGHDSITSFLNCQNSTNGFSTYQVWALCMLESWLRYHPVKLNELEAACRENKIHRTTREKVARVPENSLDRLKAVAQRTLPVGTRRHKMLWPTLRFIKKCAGVSRYTMMRAKDDPIAAWKDLLAKGNRLGRMFWTSRLAANTLEQEGIEKPDLRAFLELFAGCSRCKQPHQHVGACGSEEHFVLFTHALVPGGAERQWCYLAVGLHNAGHKVTFVVEHTMEGDRAHYLSILTSVGVRIVELAKLDVLSCTEELSSEPDIIKVTTAKGNPFGESLPKLISVLHNLRPTALFAQLDSINLLAGFAGILAGLQVTVVSFRNYNPSHFSYLRNDWYLPCYKELAKYPNIIFSGNSVAGNNDYANWIGISPSRICWIPNIVDKNCFIRLPEEDILGIQNELGVTKETPLVLGVFRLSEEKQPLLFLEVCSQLVSHIPGLRACIAGTGPMQQDLETRIKELHLSNTVIMLGVRKDVRGLMAAAKILLMTSRHEGMPNAIIEAQAMGLPVVATNVGGVSDCVQSGTSGFLFRSDDLDGLVRGCVRLLSDEVLRLKMADAARQPVCQAFTSDSVVESYINLARKSQALFP